MDTRSDLESDIDLLSRKERTPTCCCGKVELRKGIMILSTLTMIFSILFIAFSLFRNVTPWWVWGGTMTGVVGGLLGCCGAIRKSWHRMTFMYLVWAILLCWWWAAFVVFMAIDFNKNTNWDSFWDMVWSIALLIWTGYTCLVINKYYKSIRPEGATWNAFRSTKQKKQQGYNAIE